MACRPRARGHARAYGVNFGKKGRKSALSAGLSASAGIQFPLDQQTGRPLAGHEGDGRTAGNQQRHWRPPA